MKTFQSKSLLESRTVNLFKGLTLLFLGASVAVLATQAALTIDPGINNATQYIQKIILTSDGTASGVTGIVLKGDNGDAYFSGNVGIGTTSPSAKLDVTNGNLIIHTGVLQILTKNIVLATADDGFSFVGGMYTDNAMQWMIGVNQTFGTGWLSIATATNNPIKMYTNTLERMIISTGGNVGIGTSDPQSALDVSGSVSIGQMLQLQIAPLGTCDATSEGAIQYTDDGMCAYANTAYYPHCLVSCRLHCTTISPCASPTYTWTIIL